MSIAQRIEPKAARPAMKLVKQNAPTLRDKLERKAVLLGGTAA